jgi:hypothetical protein
LAEVTALAHDRLGVGEAFSKVRHAIAAGEASATL